MRTNGLPACIATPDAAIDCLDAAQFGALMVDEARNMVWDHDDMILNVPRYMWTYPLDVEREALARFHLRALEILHDMPEQDIERAWWWLQASAD